LDTVCGEAAAALAVTVTALPLTVAPPLGVLIDTVGAGTLSTVTVTPLDMGGLPASSNAFAVMVWVPFVTVVEFQLRVYGALLTEPTPVPSTRKST
jgi:hypothetical protein